MSDYTWDQLMAYAQPGETFTEGLEKDIAVLTARIEDAQRRAVNAADTPAADAPAADAPSADAPVDESVTDEGVTDKSVTGEGVDANGSPVTDASVLDAPDPKSERK